MLFGCRNHRRKIFIGMTIQIHPRQNASLACNSIVRIAHIFPTADNFPLSVLFTIRARIRDDIWCICLVHWFSRCWNLIHLKSVQHVHRLQKAKSILWFVHFINSVKQVQQWELSQSSFLAKDGLETFSIFLFYQTMDETGQRSLPMAMLSWTRRAVMQETRGYVWEVVLSITLACMESSSPK